MLMTNIQRIMYAKCYRNKREKLLISVTKIFNKDKLITEYTSKKYMDIKELIKYPCSFHPFMKSQFKEYKHFPSQDIII